MAKGKALEEWTIKLERGRIRRDKVNGGLRSSPGVGLTAIRIASWMATDPTRTELRVSLYIRESVFRIIRHVSGETLTLFPVQLYTVLRGSHVSEECERTDGVRSRMLYRVKLIDVVRWRRITRKKVLDHSSLVVRRTKREFLQRTWTNCGFFSGGGCSQPGHSRRSQIVARSALVTDQSLVRSSGTRRDPQPSLPCMSCHFPGTTSEHVVCLSWIRKKRAAAIGWVSNSPGEP